MNLLKRTANLLVVLTLVSVVSSAQMGARSIEIERQKDYRPVMIKTSAALQSRLDAAVREVIASYPAGAIKNGELAATIIDLSDPNEIKSAEFNGELKLYPASVVKMFYMAVLERQLEDGKITLTTELARGRSDMIVDSSNEATQYILDVLTDTSSGAELPQKEFEIWQSKRNRVNRYFTSLGYSNVNVNQKTFCEDAYGIEQQSRAYKGQNRNMLTTNATARLMAEIVLGRIAGTSATSKMMELMKRDPFAETKDADDQAHGFTGIALIERKMNDAKLWSKAGWTSTARHDAAYIETADGSKLVIVVFTENHANDRKIIPNIAGRIIDGSKKS